MTDLPYDGDPFEEPVDHPLIGRRVRVTLARKGQCSAPHHCLPGEGVCMPLAEDQTVVGRLVRLDAGGSFDIRCDDGTMAGGWPALDITAADEVAGCERVDQKATEPEEVTQ